MRRTHVAVAALAILSTLAAPLRALPRADVAVTSVRVETSRAGADVVLALDGEVTVSDFRFFVSGVAMVELAIRSSNSFCVSISLAGATTGNPFMKGG